VHVDALHETIAESTNSWTIRLVQPAAALTCLYPCCSQKRKNHCIAVIGDGAITGGMAYEAMNHAGFMDTNMIVILNDNQQVSRRCV